MSKRLPTLIATVLVVLSLSAPAMADSRQRETSEPSLVSRIVRVVKHLFSVAPTSEIIIPRP